MLRFVIYEVVQYPTQASLVNLTASLNRKDSLEVNIRERGQSLLRLVSDRFNFVQAKLDGMAFLMKAIRLLEHVPAGSVSVGVG